MAVESYRDLIVWQRAIELCLAIYALTANFPKDDLFAFGDQMRRASISVATHIAEGYGRASKAEYRHVLGLSRGANLELQTHLVIASRLTIAPPDQIGRAEDISNEVAKMLNSLMFKLSAPASTGVD